MNKIVLYIMVLLGAPFCCSAASLYDTVTKGGDLYAQEKYDEALNVFVDGQIEHPEDVQLKFNIASSKYMMKNYEEALAGFLDVAATARDAQLEEKALFNAGNTLYRQGKLEPAIDYYSKALELDPEDAEAKQNLEFVREELKRRMNEAKKTQEQQEQKKDQTCKNPQQQQQPDNQSSQGQSGQDQKQDQEQGGEQQQEPEQKPGADQPEKQQPAAGQKQENSDSQQDQAQSAQEREMSREQAEQLLNSVQENRDNLKKGKKAKKARAGARSGKDW